MVQTTGETRGPSIGALREVRATFRDPEAMQSAVTQLELSGFDRADLSLPQAEPSISQDTPESGARPVDTEADARQTRTLHTSGAASLAGMAAAGVVIATGGAAAPAVVAAVAGAGLAGGLAYGVSSAVNRGEQTDREQRAAAGALILSVRTPSEEKRTEAEAILRKAGGTNVEIPIGLKSDRAYDDAVEGSFPASDPPASTGIVGPKMTDPGPRQPPAADRAESPE